MFKLTLVNREVPDLNGNAILYAKLGPQGGELEGVCYNNGIRTIPIAPSGFVGALARTDSVGYHALFLTLDPSRYEIRVGEVMPAEQLFRKVSKDSPIPLPVPLVHHIAFDPKTARDAPEDVFFLGDHSTVEDYHAALCTGLKVYEAAFIAQARRKLTRRLAERIVRRRMGGEVGGLNQLL